MHGTLKERIISLENFGYLMDHAGIFQTIIVLFDYETIRVLEEELQDPRILPKINYLLGFLEIKNEL
jgi:hypothetical protein